MPIKDLDFSRANFDTALPEPDCTWCTRGLGDSYFEVEGVRCCGKCADRAQQLSPRDTRKTFLRALLFGATGAAMAGMAYYALFRIFGPTLIIFAAIGVGYIIGKCMRMGSNGIGGRRYQVMAAILTYIAVILPSFAVIIGTDRAPWWAYPFLVFAPFFQLFTGLFNIGSLELLFAAAGIRWAWTLTAGRPWKITGPHLIER